MLVPRARWAGRPAIRYVGTEIMPPPPATPSTKEARNTPTMTMATICTVMGIGSSICCINSIVVSPSLFFAHYHVLLAQPLPAFLQQRRVIQAVGQQHLAGIRQADFHRRVTLEHGHYQF